MKRAKPKPEFVDVMAGAAKFCAAIVVVGLFVPALRPYAFGFGSAFGVVMGGCWSVFRFLSFAGLPPIRYDPFH